MNFDSTHVRIDLDIIAANFRAVREKAGVPAMAVVKADAYGHGAVQVAKLLQEQCASFGVSSIRPLHSIYYMVKVSLAIIMRGLVK